MRDWFESEPEARNFGQTVYSIQVGNIKASVDLLFNHFHNSIKNNKNEWVRQTERRKSQYSREKIISSKTDVIIF